MTDLFTETKARNPDIVRSGNIYNTSLSIPLRRRRSILDDNASFVSQTNPLVSQVENTPQKITKNDITAPSITLKNPDVFGLKQEAVQENGQQSINNTIDANSALRAGNIELFKMIMGRYPTPQEVVNKSIATPDTVKELEKSVVKPTDKLKEIITVSFDAPFGEDKQAFDDYIQKLISEGRKYTITPQPDGSFKVSYSIDLNKNVKQTVGEKKPASVEEYIKKYNVFSGGKFLPSSLNPISRVELIQGLNLLGVEIPSGIVSKTDLKNLLKEKFSEMEIKEEVKPTPSLPTPSPPSSSSSSSDDTLKWFKKNSLVSITGDRPLSFKNTSRQIIIEALERLDALPQIYNERNPPTTELKEILSERLIEYIDDRKSKKKGEGAKRPLRTIKSKHAIKGGIKDLKRRIEINGGQIDSGNDNPLVKIQLKRDLIKAKENGILPRQQIRELVKKLL